MTTARSLEINIDRLVLHGVSPIHRRRVVEAMERELQRLFASDGVAGLARPGEGADLGGHAFSMTAGLDPEQIGARVARAMWASGRRAAGAGSLGASPPDDATHREPAMPASGSDISGGDSR